MRDWGSYMFNFRMFADRKDFVDKGFEALKEIKAKYNNDYDVSGARGYESNLASLRGMKSVTKYEAPDRLQKYIDGFEDTMAKIDMGGAFKKTKLIITDDKRGIFDFGLASKGLQRSREYYSADLATNSPDEFFGAEISGLVPEKLVTTVVVLGTKQYWYKSQKGEKYLLELRQEGTTKILMDDPTTPLKSALGMVFPEKHIKGLKYKTTNKKSYLMFEKKGGKAKMVELYVPFHANINLPNIIPLMLVAKFLKMYGIMTRITTVRMYHENSDLFVVHGYPMKQYGDELDFNWMALNGVDDRWWHAIRDVVKVTNDLEVYKRSGKARKSGLYGGAGGEAGQGRDRRADYMNLFSRYRNWYMKAIKKGELPPLRVDKKLMLIGGAFGDFATTEGIKAEFFRILDTVDFQFNDPTEVCKRIYNREVDDKFQEWYAKERLDTKWAKDPTGLEQAVRYKKRELTQQYKTYVQNVLIDTYTYPVGGEHEEDPESAKKLDEEMADKLEKMSNFLSTQ